MASIRELREGWMRIYDEDVGGGVGGKGGGAERGEALL